METQTAPAQDPSQNTPVMNLDPERALPETGSDKSDLMAYASEMYKALQLSRQREAKLQHDLEYSQNVSKKMGAASLYQYKDAADKALEKARLLKKAAMEAGNPEDILKADEEYMAAITAKNWSEQMIRQKEVEKEAQGDSSSPQTAPSKTDMDPRATAFMKAHPLIDPTSPSYDAEKHQEVATYAMALEMNLHNEGKSHELCSPSYFNKIEAYMKARFGTDPRSSTGQKTEDNKPKIPPLSEDEQRLCKVMKIKEEDYLKHREICKQEYAARLAAGERYA